MTQRNLLCDRIFTFCDYNGTHDHCYVDTQNKSLGISFALSSVKSDERISWSSWCLHAYDDCHETVLLNKFGNPTKHSTVIRIYRFESVCKKVATSCLPFCSTVLQGVTRKWTALHTQILSKLSTADSIHFGVIKSPATSQEWNVFVVGEVGRTGDVHLIFLVVRFVIVSKEFSFKEMFSCSAKGLSLKTLIINSATRKNLVDHVTTFAPV